MVLFKLVHSVLRVHSKVSKSLIFFLSSLEHLSLKIVVVLNNHVFLLSQVRVSVLAFLLVLLKLDSPHSNLLLDSEDTLLLLSNLLGVIFILGQKLLVVISLSFSLLDVLVEVNLELLV